MARLTTWPRSAASRIASTSTDSPENVLARVSLALVGRVGSGKVESFYFAFGSADVYVIADFPDNISAASAALTVCAGGGATARMVVLLTADAVDAAVEIQSGISTGAMQ